MRGQGPGAKVIRMDSIISVEHILSPEDVKVIYKSDSNIASLLNLSHLWLNNGTGPEIIVRFWE